MNFACIFIHFGAVCRCLHITNSPKIYKERRQSYSLKFAHFNKDATYHSGECCIAAGGVRSYKYFGGIADRQGGVRNYNTDATYHSRWASKARSVPSKLQQITTRQLAQVQQKISGVRSYTPPCPSYNLSDSLVSRLPCVS